MNEYVKLKRIFILLASLLFVTYSLISISILSKNDYKKEKLKDLSLFMLPNLSLASDASYIRLRELENTYSSFNEAIGTISILKSSFAYGRKNNEQ